MFSTHPTAMLTAFIDGALNDNDRARVESHLAVCGRCRTEVERIRAAMEALRGTPFASAPDSVWPRIESRLETRPEPTRPASRAFPARLAGGLVSAALAAAVLLVMFNRVPRAKEVASPGASWQVSRIEGAPRVAGRELSGAGRIRTGEWLVTDARSRARLQVADIGEVQVEPNTRLRLVDTRQDEHRLRLALGKMTARVTAPPRLFLVETPTALAVDLGCAYTLETREDGSTLLRVMSGWVALEWQGRESIVHTGAVCRTRPGKGPGTPYRADAAPACREALDRIDEGRPRADDLALVLRSARREDSLTLWHLLQRVPSTDRTAVCARLEAFVRLPDGANRTAALALDRSALDLWRAAVEETLAPNSTLAFPQLILKSVQTSIKGATK